MSRVINTGWIAHRCQPHGVWFVKEGRTFFERAHAEDIGRHQAYRDAIRHLADHLRAVVANDPSAIHAFALRLFKLECWRVQSEQDIAALRARLGYQ